MPHLPSSGRTPQQLGLPDGPFFFIPQTFTKITPAFDHVWKGVLEENPAAYLVMKKPFVYEKHWQTTQFTKLLKERLKAALGSKALVDRVILLDAHDTAAWLDIFRHATAVLDSYPFGGYTTTLEALALGVPVVTMPHTFLAGRCTAAFLKVCKVPQLIANSTDMYIKIATKVIRNKEFKRVVRQSILKHHMKLFASDKGHNKHSFATSGGADYAAVKGWERLMTEVSVPGRRNVTDLHGTEEELHNYGRWTDGANVVNEPDHSPLWSRKIPQHCKRGEAHEDL